MPQPSGPWLYRYAARGIQRYIFATQRLVEIVGASLLVEDLEGLARKAAQAAGDAEVLTVAAGTGTLRFTSFSALKDFAEAWPLLVHAHAPGLRVAQAWLREDAAGEHPMRSLGNALALEMQRMDVDLPEAGPLVERAGRTGKAATRRLGGGEGLADADTVRKVERAQKDKDADSDALGAKFLGPRATEGWAFTRDMGRFGDGYVAVVHLDGTGIGRRVLAATNVEAYQDLANALKACTEAAAQEATEVLVNRQLKRDGKSRILDARLAARPVILGGDDLTIITAAEDGIPFAEAFLVAFERETEQRRVALGLEPGQRSLVAAAGIAFQKADAPLHAGADLAGELCHAAKRKLPDRSGLLFHRIHTPFAAPWGEILRFELAADKTPGALAYGPYALSGALPTLGGLSQLSAAVAQLPRGPLRGWLRALHQDPTEARAHWSRFREVALGGEVARDSELEGTFGPGPKSAWKQLEEALNVLGANPETGTTEEEERTPLHDALAWTSLQRDLERAG